jgi:hypothetical protein
MNRSFQRRIAALQVTVGEPGCETCRHYAGIVLMDDEGNLSRPEQCPDCGREVPIFRLLHIVGVPLDLL